METIYKNVDNVSKSAMRLASRNAYTGDKNVTANNQLSKSMQKINSLPTIKYYNKVSRFEKKKMSRSKMEKQPFTRIQ